MSLLNVFGMGSNKDTKDSTSLKGVSQWVENLPLVDKAKSLILLQQKFMQLETSPLADADLYQRLLLLFDPMMRLSNACFDAYINDENKETYKAQLFIIKNLFFKYADLLFKLATKKRHFGMAQPLCDEMLKLSTMAYCIALLRSYQLSILLPENLWKKLYQTYGLSLKIKNDKNSEIDENKFLLTLNQSVQKSFKMILLLSIANPYQLSALEKQQIFELGKLYADKIQLNVNHSQNTAFIFQEKSNFPPKCLHYMSDDCDDAIGIDTSNFTETLFNAELKDKNFIEKLANILKVNKKRDTNREASLGNVSIVSGLQSLHSKLREDGNDMFSGIKLDVGALEDISREQLGCPFEKEILKQYYQFLHLGSDAARIKEGHESIWHKIDSSDDGLKVSAPLDMAVLQLKSNSLIGIKSEDSDFWMSAIVRWANISKDNQIEAGLQLVGEDSKAIYVQNEYQKNQGYYSRAIIVKDGFGKFTTPLIIISAKRYKPGEILSVLDGGVSLNISLKECVDSFSDFKLYRYDLE